MLYLALKYMFYIHLQLNIQQKCYFSGHQTDIFMFIDSIQVEQLVLIALKHRFKHEYINLRL